MVVSFVIFYVLFLLILTYCFVFQSDALCHSRSFYLFCGLKQLCIIYKLVISFEKKVDFSFEITFKAQNHVT